MLCWLLRLWNACQSPRDGNTCARRSSRQAVDELHAPAALFPVHGHADFGVGRGMVDRIVQNQVVRTEVADAHEVTVDRQMHLHVGRMGEFFRVYGAHDGNKKRPSAPGEQLRTASWAGAGRTAWVWCSWYCFRRRKPDGRSAPIAAFLAHASGYCG